MSKQRIAAVSRTQGNNAAIKDGSIELAHFQLEFHEVPVLVQAFRDMVRELRYDVCEMALTTYLCAREHNVQFTAIPVFLVRGFHHDAIVHNPGFGIDNPVDLAGRRVGVNRGYTVTTGVWARAILAEEYGIDLSTITWVCTSDEHVASYLRPGNVQPIARGSTIERELMAGSMAAAVNIRTDDPLIRPLIADPLEAGFRQFERSGYYPINHLVVVRNQLLADSPGLAAELFKLFVESKRRYLARLAEGKVRNPDASDRTYARILALGIDPLPYGLEPNRDMLERLIAHAESQRILRRPVELNKLFAAETINLVG